MGFTERGRRKCSRGHYQSALEAGSRSGNKEMVRMLLQRGADISTYGGGALQEASSRGYNAVVRLLVEKGANVNAEGNDRRRDALYEAARNGHAEVVQILVENGADEKWFYDAMQVASW